MKALLKQRDSRLLLAALVLLLAALFHPAMPLQRDLRNYLFVVDVTQSMNTVDMKLQGQAVSRIAYARQLLRQAVARLPCGSKVSLAVFSAENIALLYTPIEVCGNYQEIQDSVAHLEWRMAWRGNSRLRFGVKSMAAVQRALPTPAQVVFFTDGDEAPELNAVNTLDLAGWQGGAGWLIVGVGGDQPSPIPKLDSDNRILGYWAYSNSIMAPSQVQAEEGVGTRDDSIASAEYDRYLSQLDEEYLKAFSGEIGADYLRATDAEHLLRAMNRQPPAGRDIVRFQLDWILVLAALGLILAGYWPACKSRIFSHSRISRTVIRRTS